MYDTGRNRKLLERPTQLEVARLLLQGRSASDRTKASQVDGLDGEFRAPERYPDHFAFDRISGCSIAHRDRQGSGEWHRVYYWSRVHHRFVLGVRLFVFTHGMRILTDQQRRLPNVGNDVRSFPLNKNPSRISCGSRSKKFESRHLDSYKAFAAMSRRNCAPSKQIFPTAA